MVRSASHGAGTSKLPPQQEQQDCRAHAQYFLAEIYQDEGVNLSVWAWNMCWPLLLLDEVVNGQQDLCPVPKIVRVGCKGKIHQKRDPWDPC